MWFDLLVLAILIYTTIRGAAKGIVWQLAAIIALVCCFAFAGPLSLAAAPYIRVEPPLNRWLAMLGLYLVFSFASFALARSLREWIEKAKFVEYDRHVGALFGFIKGALICLTLIFFLVTISQAARGHILNSHSGYAAAIIMDRLHPVMPKELHDVLEPYIHQLDRPGMDLRYSDHAAHDDDHDHDHSGDGAGRPEFPPTDPADDRSLEELIAELPGFLDQSLHDAILRALRNTSPENRGELLNRLRSGIPGLMRLVADEWKNGKPQPPAAPQTASERDRLVREISAVYTSSLDAQETIVEDIEWALAGIPDEVALHVVRDWHSDMFVTDPDPDPQTDSLTALDDRIRRQLARAGVPLHSLTGSLQSRLQGTRSR